MTLSAEQRRFLTQNWQVLDLHALGQMSVRQIARHLDKSETYVRRTIAEMWSLDITAGDVHEYMRRI